MAWPVVCARERLGLAALLAVAVLLRWAGLGAAELWLDERFTLMVCRAPALLAALGDDVTPPLAYAVAKAGLVTLEPALGTEAALRLGSAVAGTLAVPALWAWVRRRAGPRAGLLAAALLAVHGHALVHAREARFYALLVLFGVLLLDRADRAAAAWRRRDGLALGLLGAAVVLTHTLGAALVAARGAWLLGQAARARGAPRARRAQVVALGALGLVLPLLPFLALWRTHTGKLLVAPPERIVVSLRTVEGIVRELSGVNVALHSRLGVAALAPLVVAGALACLRRGRREEPAWLLLAVGGPLLAFAAFPPGQLYLRYFDYALPLWLLLAARGGVALASLAAARGGPRAGRAALAAAAGLAVAALAHAWVEHRTLPQLQYRDVTAWLAARVRPGDRVLVHAHRAGKLLVEHGARWEVWAATPPGVREALADPAHLPLDAPPARRTYGVLVTSIRDALPEGAAVEGGVVASRRLVLVEAVEGPESTAAAVLRLAEVDRRLPRHDEALWEWAFGRWRAKVAAARPEGAGR